MKTLLLSVSIVALFAASESVTAQETASVSDSPEVAENARCRVRTCDFLRVKQALYH
jgi:hypothetical protein